MTDKVLSFVAWGDLLNAFEKANPKAFDFFYHFHSIYGLDEDDISPNDRLQDIGAHSECDFQQLVSDIRAIAIVNCGRINSDPFDIDFTETGVQIISLH